MKHDTRHDFFRFQSVVKRLIQKTISRFQMNAFEEDGFIHVDFVAFNNSDLYYVHFYVDSMLDNVRQL